MRFGVLLPHFGSRVSGAQLLEFARLADTGGFDSLWVRDHLVYDPHGFEADTGRTFVEAFDTLAFVAAVTHRVELGTAAVIPTRHPLMLAQQVASLSFLAQRRVLLGLGAGHRDAEFAAVGRPSTLTDRVDHDLPASIGLLRAAWDGPLRGEHGEHGDATIELDPKPPTPPGIWYCGTSPKALRIAQEHCTGWAPGRVTVDTMKQRIPEHRSPDFRVAAIPLVVVGDSARQALSGIDTDKLLDYARGHRWITEPSTGFRNLDDAEGLVLAGPAESFVSTLTAFSAVGVTDVIFDLRLQSADRLAALRELALSLHAYRRATC
jgi:alkanesulfonate monooxygenase SsuD/methylene tetrahydromethanopterin reductase-like flavin-dependent oxidoreductase (luciferase family)